MLNYFTKASTQYLKTAKEGMRVKGKEKQEAGKIATEPKGRTKTCRDLAQKPPSYQPG